MSDGQEYSVDSAREAALRDELGPWVVDFLGNPLSDNAELGRILSERIESWLGPVLLPLSRLHRLAGPPDDPVLCPVDDDFWDDRVEVIEERIEDEGWEPPPVIVTYRGDQLVLEDGNHRVEGLRRAGRDQAWSIVGFENDEERRRFIATVAEGEIPGTV